MLAGKFQSLRVRLALLCFLTTMIIILVSLAPFYFSETVDVTTREDGTEDVVRTISPLKAWIVPIAATLAFPAAYLAWIWAGSVVRPIVHITRTAADIQSGSLDRRIQLPNALSEFQDLAHQFNRMMDRLADESRIQTQLIEDTSHEIRTPLAILANNAEVMLADPAPNMQSYRTSTELTAKTVSRLRSTVEELLNGATFTSLRIRQSDNDLSIVAQRACDLYSAIASKKEVTLITKFPGQLLCAFDGRSVERALGNLLDNAIRFSSSGGVVKLNVGLQNDLAFASVEDSGAGIDTDNLEHVFDRYTSSAHPGSTNKGIGLAIVKQVADSHRGITVDSPVQGERGTRFTMWFQL